MHESHLRRNAAVQPALDQSGVAKRLANLALEVAWKREVRRRQLNKRPTDPGALSRWFRLRGVDAAARVLLVASKRVGARGFRMPRDQRLAAIGEQLERMLARAGSPRASRRASVWAMAHELVFGPRPVGRPRAIDERLERRWARHILGVKLRLYWSQRGGGAEQGLREVRTHLVREARQLGLTPQELLDRRVPTRRAVCDAFVVGMVAGSMDALRKRYERAVQRGSACVWRPKD